MRSIIFVALLISSIKVYGFTDAVWQDIPSTYTNLLGMEFVNEVALRSQWAGTNWAYVNSGVTNIFGSSFSNETSSGAIYFWASEADKITRQLESVMHCYVLPYYSSVSNDYSFDEWFTNGLERFPGREYPKVELFDKVGEILGKTTEQDSQNTFLGIHRNIYGEVTEFTVDNDTRYPCAWWIKRRDRYNPLVIGQWRVGQSNEFYSGWHNEFTLGDTTAYGIDLSQYPLFIIKPDDNESYIPGSISIVRGSQNVYDPTFVELTPTNMIVYLEPFADWGSLTFILSSQTQICPRAFVSLGVNVMAAADASLDGYIVSLQYTNKMNTYEGNKIWDTTLLPEQLTAHYVAMTNLFLTEHSEWGWTNSCIITNEIQQIGDTVDIDLAEDGSFSNVTHKTPEELVSFWTNSCPVFEPITLPEDMFGYGNIPTNSMPPEMRINLYIDASLDAYFREYTYYDTLIPCGETQTNSSLWEWYAYLSKYYSVFVDREMVVSSIAVTNLYPGTRHRVHVYASFGDGYPMRRISMTDWSSNSVTITDPIDISSNYVNWSMSSIPCSETDLSDSQICRTCPWVVETNTPVNVTNIYSYCWPTYDYSTNISYVTLTNPCDSNLTFVVTNTTINRESTYGSEATTNYDTVPWITASNECTGMTTSSWDGVSYSNLFISITSNANSSSSSTNFDIWVDPECLDSRTNTTITVLDEVDCQSFMMARIPNTTTITVSNYINEADPDIVTNAAGYRWGWVDVGTTGNHIVWPYDYNGDEYFSNYDFYGRFIPHDDGEPVNTMYSQMLYCGYHAKYHVTGSPGTIYPEGYDLGLGCYLHVYGRLEVDVDYGIPEMVFPIIGDYATGHEAVSDINSAYNGTYRTTNYVNSIKLLIEWEH